MGIKNKFLKNIIFIFLIFSGLLYNNVFAVNKTDFFIIQGASNCNSPNFSVLLKIKDDKGNFVYSLKQDNSFYWGCTSGSWLWGSKWIGANNCTKTNFSEDKLNYYVDFNCKGSYGMNSGAANGSGYSSINNWNGKFTIPKNTIDFCKINNVFCSYNLPIFNFNPVILNPTTQYNPLDKNTQICISNEYIKTTSEISQTKDLLNVGDPVNLANGEFGYDNTFMSISGNKLPFELKLNYKNQLYYVSPVGNNWDHNYNEYLIEENNGNVLFYNGKLGVFRFIKSGDNFEYNKGLKANLLKIDNKYKIIYDSKKIHSFNEKNKLDNIKDQFSNTLSFLYTDDLLSKVIDTLGREITYSYNEDKKLIKVTDFNGNYVSLNYYSDSDTTGTKNDLKSVTINNNGISKSTSFEYTTSGDDTTKHNLTKLIDSKNQTYVENIYDNDRVKTQKYGNGDINYSYTLSGSDVIQNTVIDREGHKTDYFYEKGQNIKMTVYDKDKTLNYGFEYNDLDYLSKQILPKGNGYIYSYDFKGNLIEKRFSKDLNQPVLDTDLVTTYTYNDNNQVLVIIQPNGNKIENTYDLNGNLIQTKRQISGKDALTTYEYDNIGNLVKTISPNGNITTFTYENGLLTKLSKLGKNSDGIITSFKYDKYGNIVQKIDGNGNITTLSYNDFNNLIKSQTPEGIETTSEYDVNNNLIKQSSGFEDNKTEINYNLLDKPSEIISKINKDTTSKITKEYDKNDNLIKITFENNTKLLFEYNTFSKVSKKIIVDADNKTYSTSYEYDDNGNLTKEINQLNQTTKYEYDLFDRLIKKVDNVGNYIFLTYDKVGNILFSENYNKNDILLSKQINKYNESNQILETISVDLTTNQNITQKSEYDLEGNLVKKYDAKGNVQNYTYDEFNRIIEISDALNNSQIFNYDKNNNLIQKQIIQSNGKTTTIKYTYDKDNRLITQTDNLGNKKTFNYNNLNQISSSIDENNNKTDFEYNYLGKVTKKIEYFSGTTIQNLYTYDTNQNLTSITDGNGNKTSYVYDSLNKLIKEIYPDNKEVSYKYDDLGNLIEKKDPNGSIQNNIYDNLNRLIEKNITLGEGVIGTIKETYTYDDVGRLITSENFDNFGTISKISFTYNSLNQLITETNNGNTISYEYDLNGNNTKIIYPSGKIVTKNYDELNRLAEITKDNTTITDYNYSGLELLEQINGNNTKTSYSYDEIERLKTLNEYNYTYDNVGNITNDGKDSYTYDEKYRVLGVNYDKRYDNRNTGNRIQKYNYDNTGNRISQENYKLREIQEKVCETQTIQEEYKDAKGKIKTRNKVVKNCDKIKKTIQKELNKTIYDTNILNQYTKVSNITPKGEVKSNITLVYDNNGNIIQDENNKYFYDYKNRLIKVIKNPPVLSDIPLNKGDLNTDILSKILVEYSYDTLGRRLTKTTFEEENNPSQPSLNNNGRSKIVKYTYAGENAIVEELKNKDKLIETKENIYSNNIDDIVSSDITKYKTIKIQEEYKDKKGKTKTRTIGKIQLETNTYYYTKNHLGSITSITNNSGETIEEYAYDLYGTAYIEKELFTRNKAKKTNTDDIDDNEINTNQEDVLVNNKIYVKYNGVGIINNSRLYTGREYDKEIGLYYYRARYYNADLGRFISRDPIGQSDDVNLYAYVGNNPVMFGDPSGEVKMAIVGAVYITGEFLVDSFIGIETAGGDDGVTEYKEYSIADEVGLDEETLQNAGYVGTAITVGYGGYKIYKDAKKGRVDKVLGGAYKDVRKANIGGEVHHIPSVAVSPYSKDKGSSIWMNADDHKITGSYKKSKESDLFRKKEAELINAGKIDEAFEMGIKDIQNNFGNKYNKGINQMKDYFYNNLK